MLPGQTTGKLWIFSQFVKEVLRMSAVAFRMWADRFGEQQDPRREPSRTLHAPVAELHVRNPNFWLRLCAMGDLGFSEAYMYGEIDCEDLVKVFLVCVFAL